MIKLKTEKEIALIREGGKILAEVISAVMKKVKPGVATGELNDLAEALIKQAGGKPSFKNYRAAWSESVYPAALCVSLNEEVVHGIPLAGRKIKSGDIVSLDCGLEYKGFFTDMAKTMIAGKTNDKKIGHLIQVTEEALFKGIKRIRPGKKLSEISKAVQAHVEKNGFSVVKQLVGHGVGYKPHEEPQIPNYFDPYFKDMPLQVGMVLAIEPMVNMGGWEVETLDDDWTVSTLDKSLSAHFEHTVVVTEKGYEILTKS